MIRDEDRCPDCDYEAVYVHDSDEPVGWALSYPCPKHMPQS